MAIDALRDGFIRLCFDPSLNVLGDRCALVLEGQFYDDGNGGAVDPDVLRKVTSVADINSNFGAGSVLAESLKVALSCCGSAGVEVFALPRADAVGSTAAVYTLDVVSAAGATTPGRIDVFVGDSRWNISVRVATGDTQEDIAANIVAAWDALDGFPYTAEAGANADPLNIITLTARNAGTVGNFLRAEFNWHGRNNYAPEGVTLSIVQATVGAGDPVGLDYEAIFGECCVCGYALLSGSDAWQDDVDTYLKSAWACDKPQCFGHGYTYNAGSLGEVLASDTNTAEMSRLAHGVSAPILPWLKVAAYAAKSVCLTVDNPEISIQGNAFGVLDCVRAPETCGSDWTFAERDQLDAAGFVTTVPVSSGEGALTSPQIVNDITNNRFDIEGRENLTFRSVASRRLAAATAEALSEQLRQFNGLGFFTGGTAIRTGTQGTNPNAILGSTRAWAKSQVGVLFSEFDNLNEDLTLTTDFETAPACQGLPGVLAINLKYRPPVRVNRINVNAAPRLLDNCN